MESATEAKTATVQSEQIDKVATALVAAQGEMTNPPKTKTVYAGQKKYSFAPLPEIIDAVRPVLKKHGLAVIQLVQDRTLSTRVVHTSGQWIGSMYTLPPVSDSQAMGSAITYARRYSLCAILGIAGEDDEDGEAATEAERMEADAKRKEAEKALDELKGKGKLRSAYDGKVLEPGEATLPGERAGNVETLDQRPETADRKTGKTAGNEKPEVRSQKTEGKPAGQTGNSKERVEPGAEVGRATRTPTLSPPRERESSEMAGIDKRLADLMRRDGITPEALKAYYVGKGHLPDTVEPSALPADYIVGLTKSENWKKAVAAIKGKG
jgi:hypothetical protein